MKKKKIKKKKKFHSAVSILRERATDIYPSRRNDGVGIVHVMQAHFSSGEKKKKKKKKKFHSAVSILRERATDIYPPRRNDGVGIVGVKKKKKIKKKKITSAILPCLSYVPRHAWRGCAKDHLGPPLATMSARTMHANLCFDLHR